jgi:hypothetical protein
MWLIYSNLENHNTLHCLSWNTEPHEITLTNNFSQGEVKNVMNDLKPLKFSWQKYGCSIVTIGITYKRGKSLTFCFHLMKAM